MPEKTIFIITTDGMENASRRYTAERVREMIRREQEKYGWEFLFLGANIDAVETACTYGIQEDHAVRYECDAEGIALNYATVSMAVGKMRGKKKLDADWKADIERDYRTRGSK